MTDPAEWGCMHTAHWYSEQPDLFGPVIDGMVLPAAARNMSALWASFANSDVPAAPGQPAWPRYTTGTRATMLIDAECRVVNDPDSEERKLWEDLRG